MRFTLHGALHGDVLIGMDLLSPTPVSKYDDFIFDTVGDTKQNHWTTQYRSQ